MTTACLLWPVIFPKFNNGKIIRFSNHFAIVRSALRVVYRKGNRIKKRISDFTWEMWINDNTLDIPFFFQINCHDTVKFWWVDWCQTSAYVECWPVDCSLWTIFAYELVEKFALFSIATDFHLGIVVISSVATNLCWCTSSCFLLLLKFTKFMNTK